MLAADVPISVVIRASDNELLARQAPARPTPQRVMHAALAGGAATGDETPRSATAHAQGPALGPLQHHGDHERAREAVQSGQVLPLRTVLERLEREHPGEVLEVELEREHDRWVYEVKLLQPGGQLLKLEVDASTGEVIGRRERPPRHDRDIREPLDPLPLSSGYISAL